MLSNRGLFTKDGQLFSSLSLERSSIHFGLGSFLISLIQIVIQLNRAFPLSDRLISLPKHKRERFKQ